MTLSYVISQVSDESKNYFNYDMTFSEAVEEASILGDKLKETYQKSTAPVLLYHIFGKESMI